MWMLGLKPRSSGSSEGPPEPPFSSERCISKGMHAWNDEVGGGIAQEQLSVFLPGTFQLTLVGKWE